MRLTAPLLLMLLTGCAMAARVGSVAGGAALGSLAGPVGAAAGGAGGLLVYESVEGDMLQDRVTEAALASPQVNIWPDLSGWIPWVVAGILLFTPSGQYLLRKLRKRLDAKGLK